MIILRDIRCRDGECRSATFQVDDRRLGVLILKNFLFVDRKIIQSDED